MALMLLIFVIFFIWISRGGIRPYPISEDIANDLVNETPRCPDCGSFDLTLIDNADGLPWLKGHVAEIDYYQCNRCARRFNDEDWYNAKKYGDSIGRID